MSLRPDGAAIVQDMPPQGGYKKIDFTRRLPDRGPKGWQLWAGSAVMIAYGFYKVGQSNQEKTIAKLHERQVRYTLAPYLQAEADREYLQRELMILSKEKEIMKDVAGWKVGQSPYNSQKKWLPRAVGEFDRNTK